MTPPNEKTSEDTSNGPTNDWSDFHRRPLLRALGVGTALSLSGGVATASEAADTQDGRDDSSTAQADGEAESQQIDPVYGYTTRNAEDIPEAFDPDHEVELLAAPPTPGQPPFIYFDPIGLHIDSGDLVQFTAVTPDHTVTAYHSDIFHESRVPENVPPFSSPILVENGAWLYRFEHEGVYDLYCGPHHVLGMVARFVVGDLAEEDLPAYAETVEGIPGDEKLSEMLNAASEQNENCEWPFLTPAEVLGADPLDPMNIQEEGEVPFSAVAEELGYEFEPPEMPPEGDAKGGNETAGGNKTKGNATNGNETGG